MTRLLVLACACIIGSACTTYNSARPIKPGEHAVSVTAGGPLTDIPNIGVIPLPNLTVEGRHGLIPRLDMNYGTHLLPLAYGVLGAHLGGAFQLNDQPDPLGPALTIGQRIFGFTNIIDGRKPNPGFWGMSQTDFTASWDFFEEHLLYAGGTGYWAFNNNSFYLTPFMGLELVPGVPWMRVQLEARYLAPYINQRFAVVKWVAPGDQGGILLNAGVAMVWGGDK